MTVASVRPSFSVTSLRARPRVRWGTRAALALVLLLGLTGATRAQSILGTVRGTVFDAQRNVVPGASVVVTDESTNVARDAVTDTEGNFEVSGLRPGSYRVEVSLA